MINFAAGTATSAIALSSLLFALVYAPSVRAQEKLTQDEENVISFGFATQLGSGVYSVSGTNHADLSVTFQLRIPGRG